MTARAKFVLNVHEMHRALGLGPSMHVVQMMCRDDPNVVYVVVEGPGVEATDDARMAADGLVEAPVMRWPRPAGPPVRDEVAVGATVQAPESAARSALWDSAVAAHQAGASVEHLVSVVRDAAASVERGQEDQVRRELVDVADQVGSLIGRLLQIVDGRERSGTPR